MNRDAGLVSAKHKKLPTDGNSGFRLSIDESAMSVPFSPHKEYGQNPALEKNPRFFELTKPLSHEISWRNLVPFSCRLFSGKSLTDSEEIGDPRLLSEPGLGSIILKEKRKLIFYSIHRFSSKKHAKFAITKKKMTSRGREPEQDSRPLKAKRNCSARVD